MTVLIAVVAAGCGSGSAGSVPAEPTPADADVYQNAKRGFSVTIPAGWHRAERRLTPLTDPVEVLIAATYRPEAGSEDCGPLAFGGFDADQVMVTVLERGLDAAAEWADFPPRPAHFEFHSGRSSEFASCLRDTRGIPLRDDWFTFTDAGRHFHVLVVIGADAPHAAALDAYRMLDSLRFDPSVKPDWRSSG